MSSVEFEVGLFKWGQLSEDQGTYLDLLLVVQDALEIGERFWNSGSHEYIQ